MKPLPIFIGFDPREAIAYHVFAHSILSRASIPVSIVPLVQSPLRAKDLFWRGIGENVSTEFSFTRFLVPYLSGYRGLAIFADCDMVMKADVAELLEIAEEERLLHGDGPAVLVAKHDYVPRSLVKMDGQKQVAYPRKNWSSFIVFDCAKCTTLTPRYVSSASAMDLHRFNWLGSAPEPHIGSLPLEWNHLVGEYGPNPNAKNLHFTLGGPWFPGYENCEHATDWYEARDAMFGHVPVVTS